MNTEKLEKHKQNVLAKYEAYLRAEHNASNQSYAEEVEEARKAWKDAEKNFLAELNNFAKTGK